ncbi:MAG: hypothetical protein IJ515_01655 [Clostridia bacterium]|nr:hypothetical protein [Clostridia bacterium]
MITEKSNVLKITAGKVSEPARFEIISENAVVSVDWKITDANGSLCAQGNATAPTFEVLFDAKPWSASSPVMYTATLAVKYANGESEQICDRFGYRYIGVDEKNIYLNGFPFYMRAYIRGCAAHEHQNNCNLSEYDFYKKNILTAKSYGYNTIRFHSTIPTDECFRAADDLGMLIHIEMRPENDDYNNLTEMLYGKNDFVSDEELLGIIHRLYNHPSFMVYCVGNEIRQPGKNPRIREICDLIKLHDKTRLFIDTCAHGEFDRDYVDFDVQHMGYYFPYGRNADMFSDTDNLLGFGTVRDREMVVDGENGAKIRRGIKFTRPLIAHEVCHYTSWRDYYSLKEKFEKYGKKAPWWVDEEIKLLEAKGYKESFAQTLQITKDFQFRAWKNALEGIRASHLLSGFHMLQFADTEKYENSNGVVDCFDDPHGISPEEFCKFNADTVVLARLPKQIYFFGETVKIPVLLSQYMINPPKTAEFSYKLSADGRELLVGAMTDVDTAASGLYDLCSLEFKIPTLEVATKLTLECGLKFCDGTECVNSWELWAFPSVTVPTSIDAKSDMTEKYLDRVIAFNPDSDLTVTDKLDDSLFEALDEGRDVILIYRTDWTRHLLHKGMAAPEYSFRHVWDRYKAVIWDRGTVNGGRDEAQILNRGGFVTDGQINFQYYPLIDDSDKITLDDFPVRVKSLVSGLDKANRDRFDVTKFQFSELRYERTMRNFSYAFDVRVGKGRLLVTGFNFTLADKENPAVIAMLKALVSYCHSADFGSGEHISTADLKAYLRSVAEEGPQKEGMMTQYWQLDAEPVESMAYWVESERYLREDT